MTVGEIIDSTKTLKAGSLFEMTDKLDVNANSLENPFLEST